MTANRGTGRIFSLSKMAAIPALSTHRRNQSLLIDFPCDRRRCAWREYSLSGEPCGPPDGLAPVSPMGLLVNITEPFFLSLLARLVSSFDLSPEMRLLWQQAFLALYNLFVITCGATTEYGWPFAISS